MGKFDKARQWEDNARRASLRFEAGVRQHVGGGVPLRPAECEACGAVPACAIWIEQGGPLRVLCDDCRRGLIAILT